MTYLQTAQEMATQLRSGQTTSESLVVSALTRIQKTDPVWKAYLSVFNETAITQAKTIDDARAKGVDLPPFAGIPIAIKDNICLEGAKTTCASKILENYVSPYDATVVTRLKSHGLIPIGKTNMDEFAMGSSTENSAFQKTANPWNSTKVPGGSSGGSAVAVAGGSVPWSIGSDTGGSIRQPASFCGVVGVKPTYGRVSRFGLVAFASSLDQIGPFARNVEDAAHLLTMLSGHDPFDATSSQKPVPDFSKALNRSVKGLRLGIPLQLFSLIPHQGVKDAVMSALDLLKSEGAMIDTIPLDIFDVALPAYYILATAEASANLARYDGVRFGLRVDKPTLGEMITATRTQGFGPEVKRRIMLGTFSLSSGYYDAYYSKAQKVRQVIWQTFQKAFETVDIIVTPTTPTPAFSFGEKEDPLSMYLSDISTIPVNLAGLPALSVPCGLSDNLPLGLQMIGRAFEEETLFSAAAAYERLQPFPKISEAQR